MATTFYLSQGAAPVTVPMTDASAQWPNGWYNVLGLSNKYLTRTIGVNGAGAVTPWQSPPTTSHIDTLITRFISDPLTAQTFGSGTWTFACGPTEEAAAANARIGISLQVWRPSTSALVGYIYDTHVQLGNEWATAVGSAGRVMTFAGSNVTSQVGDVVILEVWCHQATQDNATARNLTFPFGGGTVPTEGSAVVNANIACYLSTATTIGFYAAPPVVDIEKVGLANYGCTGTLTIRWSDALATHDLSMNCPAWDILDLTPLLTEYGVRGQDRRVPGLVGVVPYRRRMDVTEHALGMWISGDVDRNGAQYADSRAGLEQNIKYLRDTIVNPDIPTLMPTDGTRYATLTTRSGPVMTAYIHVLGMRVSEVLGADDHAWVNAVLQISIPAGTFIYP